MIDFDKQLNAEQCEVVLHGNGPCLVLAGAGSGKTRAITYRVAYLLSQGVDPREILLLTFTNKAAREMKQRVVDITQRQSAIPWSGTFHSIAFRILKRHADVVGYTPDFSIIDSEDSRTLIKSCIEQEGIDRSQKRFPSPAVVHAIISFARNSERAIIDVLDEQHPHWMEYADTLSRIAESYTQKKREHHVMDFDDLLVNLFLLLSGSPGIRAMYASQFRYILVDEYQDTNTIQASIIHFFASVHRNVLVVGDDAQSIYSFRAADISNILDFEKNYTDARIFRLETNYRSTPDILTVAQDVIAQNRRQHSKKLISVQDAYAKPEVHACVDAREEARFIADRIEELVSEGTVLSEIAVLFRAAFHSQSLEMELTRRQIPYEYRGGVRFFERAHVKDVLGFVRVFVNRGDMLSWMRVLTLHKGIGPAGATKIATAIQHMGEGDSLDHVGSVLSARSQSGWSDFLRTWRGIVDAVTSGPGDMIRAVARSPYLMYLESEYPDYRDRLQDIEQLAIFADRYVDTDGTSRIQEFLAEAALQEYDADHASSESEEDAERMVLSTIHQAKGLEWEVVFVLHLSAGQFPSERSTRRGSDVEEERRLFYVAITRAKKLLYLSYPLLAHSFSVLQGPSIFIDEIDPDLVHIEHSNTTDSLVFSDPSDDVDEITYEPMDSDHDRPRRGFLKSLDEL